MHGYDKHLLTVSSYYLMLLIQFLHAYIKFKYYRTCKENKQFSNWKSILKLNFFVCMSFWFNCAAQEIQRYPQEDMYYCLCVLAKLLQHSWKENKLQFKWFW